MPINSASRRGFSLAELLLAVALTVVVVLALVALALTALQSGQKSNDLTLAQSTAHELIESTLYQATQNKDAPLWDADDDLNPYSVTPISAGNQNYVAALYVVDAKSTDVPGLRRCRLRLSWWGGDDKRAGYGQLHTEVVRFASLP